MPAFALTLAALRQEISKVCNQFARIADEFS
jgi:hypothetical protein